MPSKKLDREERAILPDKQSNTLEGAIRRAGLTGALERWIWAVFRLQGLPAALNFVDGYSRKEVV